MKARIFSLLLAVVLLLSSCQSGNPQAQELTVVASFYPVYVALLNITDGVPGIAVSNLTEQSTGCLHDYTLTTLDLKKLSHADILFINGAGMEPFMDKIEENMTNLCIVDTSKGITLLKDNPHIWMSLKNYIQQIDTITASLCELSPDYRDAFQKNAAAYEQKLHGLETKIQTGLAPFSGSKMVTFHEAFDYFAEEFTLEVVATIQHDEHSAPTPNDMKNTITLMKKDEIHALFAEPGNADSAIKSIADATGAVVYTLDPVTAPRDGLDDRDAYITAMEKNLETLEKAFS